MYLCVSLCLHQVALLGLDLLSALVTRLQERFKAQVVTGKTQIFFFFALLLFVWYLYCVHYYCTMSSFSQCS